MRREHEGVREKWRGKKGEYRREVERIRRKTEERQKENQIENDKIIKEFELKINFLTEN